MIHQYLLGGRTVADAWSMFLEQQRGDQLIKEIERLVLAPDEVLLITIPGTLTQQAAAQIKDLFTSVFPPGAKIIVKPDIVGVEVVKVEPDGA